MNKGLKFILINVAIVAGVLSLILFILFGIYLPNFTRHGETITVPNLMDKDKSELATFLESKDLRYEIVDSMSYEKGKDPNVVVSQRPVAGTLVKENRKIYVNINASDVPMVKMPKIAGESVDNARSILQDELGFIIDSVRYKITHQQDMALGVYKNGEEVKEGTELPRGSFVDLLVSRKGATRKVAMPNVIGDPLRIAQRRLRSLGLQPTLPIPEPESTAEKGTVTKQNIAEGDSIPTGTDVDLWYAGDQIVEKEESDSTQTKDP